MKKTLADWAQNLLLRIGPSPVGNYCLSWLVLFNPWLHEWPKSKSTNTAEGWGVRVVKKTRHWTELLLKMGACKHCVLQHSQKRSDTCREERAALTERMLLPWDQQPQKRLDWSLHSYTKRRSLILEGSSPYGPSNSQQFGAEATKLPLEIRFTF